jgi:phosphomannomutase
VVVNESTSESVAEVARSFGVPFHRAAVGERNVVDRMRATAAVIGGEGNGGVIWPAVQYARDAVAGMALVLEKLTRHRAPLSACLREFAAWRSARVALPDRPGLLDQLAARFARRLVAVTAASGYRFEHADGWVTVRRSNTEPVIRVIGEGRTRAFLTWLRSEVESWASAP